MNNYIKTKAAYALLKNMTLLISILTISALSPACVHGVSALSKPGKVTWNSVSSTATSVSLTWKKARGAYGYTIYKKYGNHYRPIKSIRRLKYRDHRSLRPLAYYRYYVKAYKLNGKKKIYGRRSAVKKIKTKSGIPSAVTVKNVAASIGSSVKFTAVVNGGTAPFVFQWYRGSQAIAGEKNNTYSFVAASGDYNSQYHCTVTNKYGTVSSNNASLIINIVPLTSVTVNGSSTIAKGGQGTFKAVVTGGTQPLTYQWYRNDTPVPGATTETYTTETLNESNSGDSYKCKVTGIDGNSVISNAVIITVTVPRSIIKSWSIGADSANVVYSDSLATSNVVAELYDDGVLEIRGSGNTALMIDNQANFVAPWHSPGYVSQIKNVDIQAAVQTTDMRGWFADCENLIGVNRIPGSALILWKTFWGCSSMKSPPEIPFGVISMMSAFSGCSALTSAPVIPASVQDMYAAFFMCTSLEVPTDIPSSVTNLYYTFAHCRKLSGTITIYSGGITNYTGCFSDTAISGDGVRVYGSTSADNEALVQNIAGTAGTGSSVTYEGLH